MTQNPIERCLHPVCSALRDLQVCVRAFQFLRESAKEYDSDEGTLNERKKKRVTVARQRLSRALELREKGYKFKDIGADLGVTSARGRAMYLEALELRSRGRLNGQVQGTAD